MLLAAGFGTRLKPYTLLRPKPLFPVLNQPLLWHALQQLEEAGCQHIIVNAHHLAGQIEAAVQHRPPGPARIRLQIEPEILGTGGSLREALPQLADEPLLVMNGDLFHSIDLLALLAAHRASGKAVTLALHDLPRFNTVHIAGDCVTGFGSVGQLPEDQNLLAFTGVQVVNPEVLERIPAHRFFHIIDLYQELAQTGIVGFVRVDKVFWQDMGTPADYLDLHQKLLQPDEWRIEDKAQVSEEAQLLGWGCIGVGASIGPGARLENCVVWDGALVPEQACFANRIITGDPEVDSEEKP